MILIKSCLQYLKKEPPENFVSSFGPIIFGPRFYETPPPHSTSSILWYLCQQHQCSKDPSLSLYMHFLPFIPFLTTNDSELSKQCLEGSRGNKSTSSAAGPRPPSSPPPPSVLLQKRRSRIQKSRHLDYYMVLTLVTNHYESRFRRGLRGFMSLPSLLI